MLTISWARGTKWNLSIDGNSLATVDTGASQLVDLNSLDIYALTEFCNDVYNTVSFTDPKVLQNGTWTTAAHGVYFNANGQTFPVQGNLQDPTVSPYGFLLGGTLLSVSQGTLLW